MWQPNPEVQDPEVHIQVRVPREEEPVIPIREPEEERKVHRFPIRARDAQRRGLWADRCLGCRCIRDGLTPQGHNEECRASIEAKLIKDEDPRVTRDLTRQMWQHVKRDREEEGHDEEMEKYTKAAPNANSAKRNKTRQEI